MALWKKEETPPAVADKQGCTIEINRNEHTFKINGADVSKALLTGWEITSRQGFVKVNLSLLVDEVNFAGDPDLVIQGRYQ